LDKSIKRAWQLQLSVLPKVSQSNESVPESTFSSLVKVAGEPVGAAGEVQWLFLANYIAIDKN
jgi:hypothetical protein